MIWNLTLQNNNQKYITLNLHQEVVGLDTFALLSNFDQRGEVDERSRNREEEGRREGEERSI